MAVQRLPTVEVHITNIHQRESFRHHSYISKAAKAVVGGFGVDGYVLAIAGLAGLAGETEKLSAGWANHLSRSSNMT